MGIWNTLISLALTVTMVNVYLPSLLLFLLASGGRRGGWVCPYNKIVKLIKFVGGTINVSITQNLAYAPLLVSSGRMVEVVHQLSLESVARPVKVKVPCSFLGQSL